MSTNATSTASAGAGERNHRLGHIADHIAAAVAADSSAAVVSFAARRSTSSATPHRSTPSSSCGKPPRQPAFAIRPDRAAEAAAAVDQAASVGVDCGRKP